MPASFVLPGQWKRNHFHSRDRAPLWFSWTYIHSWSSVSLGNSSSVCSQHRYGRERTPFKGKKEEKRNPLPEPNLSLHSMKQSLHKLPSLLGRLHEIVVQLKCTGSALFMPYFFPSLLTPSPLKWVYMWQHLCYLRNSLAKNNHAHRSRLFLHLPAEKRGT